MATTDESYMVKGLLKSALHRTGLLPVVVDWRQRIADHDWWKALMQEALFYRQFVSPGQLVFDVGANVGFKSEAFRRIGASVVAVEALPANAAPLRERFAYDGRLCVVEAAVSDHIGEATLWVGSRLTMCSLNDWWDEDGFEPGVHAEGRRPVRVPTTTLDALVAEHGRPAFIKIDVESHEPEVLAGLSAAVPALSFEFCPRLPDLTLACVDRLQRLGDYRYNLGADTGEGTRLVLDQWLDASAFCVRATRPSGPIGEGRGGDVYARLAA